MTSEPVGSLAEEAARLIAALQGWTQDQRPHGERDRPPADGDPADATRDHAAIHDDPLATECRFCPLCALARMAKAATPEVRDHLSSAALSLALAVKGLLDNEQPGPATSTPVEKIDLTED